MAKAVADVDGEDQGGYASDGSSINGFSHMHDSGTGGVRSIPRFLSHLHDDFNINYNSMSAALRSNLLSEPYIRIPKGGRLSDHC